jgi:hypothetical protein
MAMCDRFGTEKAAQCAIDELNVLSAVVRVAVIDSPAPEDDDSDITAGEVIMKAVACVGAFLSSAAMSVSAQGFVNLDFDEAQLPAQGPGFVTLPWEEAAPGWGHSAGDSTDYVYYDFSHLGYSQFYVLESAPFGAASGLYGFGMRSGTFHEQEPRGDFVPAFLSQTGRLGAGVASVSLLTSSAFFGLSLNGEAIVMHPVGLDPASPTYAEDVLTYVGEWTGDVSAFAGQAVELRITDELPPTNFSPLNIDEIQFLPVPEVPAAAMFGSGLLGVLLAAHQGATRRRRRESSTPSA